MAGKRGAPLGNQNNKKAKLWEQALKRALARLGGTVDKGLDILASKMVNAANNGDEAAAMIVIEKIADRIDGKPVAVQEISGPDGEPVAAAITFVGVSSDGRRPG